MLQAARELPNGPSVLLIDDDDHIRSMVRARLEASNFDVIEADTGEAGLRLAGPHLDVVIVDLGLPGIDGFTVVRALRERFTMPIIMLTGASAEADRVLGLEIGADDYVVKPFLTRELVARVKAAIRRSSMSRPTEVCADDPLIRFDGLVVDLRAKQVRRGADVVPLTNREFDLLAFLTSSPRQVFSRDQLLRQVWHTEPGWLDPSTVTEHVHRLRRHIEVDPARPERLVTVRGVGYRFDL